MVVLIISEVFNNHTYLIVLLLNVQFNIMTMYLPLTRSYTQISEIIFLSHMNFFFWSYVTGSTFVLIYQHDTLTSLYKGPSPVDY